MSASTNMNTLSTRVSNIDSDYQGCAVAWNDGQRGVGSNGAVSCWGGNITDTRLEAEDGRVIPFVRPNNLDETVGVVSAKDVMMIDSNGEQVTAQEVLQDVAKRSEYMGYKGVDARVKEDEKVIVRVQNIWVPMNGDEKSIKVAPTNYSYQTTSSSNPRNMTILGTPSGGIYIDSDEPGMKKLMGHTVSEDGTVNEHWHTVRPSEKLVGEKKSPSKRARVAEMGLRGMGERTNCFVVLSIPNKQTMTQARSFSMQWGPLSGEEDNGSGLVFRSLCSMGEVDGVSRVAHVEMDEEVHSSASKKEMVTISRSTKMSPAGEEYDEPIVVTIMLYNTVQANSSVVNVADKDLKRAIDEMKDIYSSHCDVSCKLSHLPAMLHKLEKKDMDKIATKLATDSSDPFSPTPNAVAAALVV